MTTFRVPASAIAGILKTHLKVMPKVIDHGLYMAALRAHKYLVRTSKVDLGQFKQSWKVIPRPLAKGGHTVRNDAPHAGIIELGARPHPVGREGLEALAAWAKRKLIGGMTRKAYVAAKGSAAKGRRGKPSHGIPGQSWQDREAMSIAFAIAKKIAKEGQKGTFQVKAAMPKITAWAQDEVNRALNKALTQLLPKVPPKTGGG